MSLNELENVYKTQIIKYRALLEQGALSQSEYEELVFDLMETCDLKHMLKSEENKIAAEKILKSLMSLASVVSK